MISWDKMISASSIRNYMLKDTLSDWLKYYNIIDVHNIRINTNKKRNVYAKYIKNNKNIRNNKNVFLNYIMSQGNKFEEMVYNELKDNYNCIKVAESYEARSVEKFNKTIECMKEGYDIIHQGVFHSYDSNLYGCPDLIVRSDKLKEIFNCDIIDDYKSIKLGLDYHYVIIDIKHSSITMAANCINFINNKSIPAYKGQVYIYNKILGEIQGYEPRYGYILGKKYEYKNYDDYNYLNNLAVIDYQEYDKKYIEEVNDAIKWLLRVRTEGSNWNLLPLPSVPELYPNMKVNNFNEVKEKISNEIGEITSIWNCNIKNRENCHKRKIYTWKDEKCDSEALGFRPSKRAKIIDNIINVNRNRRRLIDTDELFAYDWDNFSENKKEFYLDFETVDGNMSNLSGGSNQYIFMIGIGWEENNKWVFKCFKLDELTNRDERKMLNEFFNFLKEKEKYFNQEPLLLHWTKAEPTFLKKACSKYNLNYKLEDIEYFDLYDLFVDNFVSIKGCFNYSLKSVAKAMYDNNMIDTLWDKNNECSNGLNAMYYAMEYYNNQSEVSNEDIINNIIKYNEVDCKVMYEILKYLRKSYSNYTLTI
jgi:hypothetical protein